MSKRMIVEEKDGRVHVEMSVRQWREMEKVLAAARLARILRRADKQCDSEPNMSREDVYEFLDSLKND